MPINLALVEGNDDFRVVAHLLHAHWIEDGIVKIEDKKGIDNLLESLQLQIKISGMSCIGIVVDSDIEARWQHVKQILTQSRYQNIPASPDKAGTILSTAGLPTLSVWIMPDNTLPGMLETFISFLAPQR